MRASICVFMRVVKVVDIKPLCFGASGYHKYVYYILYMSLLWVYLCLSNCIYICMCVCGCVCITIYLPPSTSVCLVTSLSHSLNLSLKHTHPRAQTLPCSIKDNDLKGIAGGAPADVSLFKFFHSNLFYQKFQKLRWIQKPQKDWNRKFVESPLEYINSFSFVIFIMFLCSIQVLLL